MLQQKCKTHKRTSRESNLKSMFVDALAFFFVKCIKPNVFPVLTFKVSLFLFKKHSDVVK